MGSIKIFFVTDENNISVPYKESTSIIGGQVIKIIKIGDRKVTFNGVKKYNIGYTFSHALSRDNTNPNGAYLYFNITGNAWPFKVEKGEFSIVSGPGGPKLDTSKAECFTGRFG